MKGKIIIGIFILLPIILDGQEWMDFIRTEKNYNKIQEKAEAYFIRVGKDRGTGYKQYMRWRGLMDAKVGPSGEIRNFAALDYLAYQQVRRSQPTNRSTNGGWEDLGPSDYYTSDSYSGGGVGRVNCMAFHPTDMNTFWVGTPIGGLWKTTDGGDTWIPMTDHFASIGISGIVVDQTNPDIIYVLTGDGDGLQSPSIGVMKTIDGGNNWTPTGLQFGQDQFVHGYKLIGHPTDPSILFAVFANLGIYRSSDAGEHWAQVVSDRTVWDIEYKPTVDSVMYAAAKMGLTGTLLKSEDTGQTWFEEHDPDFPDSCTRVAITVSIEEPNYVFILFGGKHPAPGTFGGVFWSINSGNDFSPRATTPNILSGDMSGSDMGNQAGYDLAFISDPSDASILYVGGINLWKSNTSGASFFRQTWWQRNDPLNAYVHADWHNLYFNNNTLYANVDGGIYKSTDSGHSWTELSTGLSIMQFYEIDIHNDEYMGGTQDNGTNASNVNNPQAHNIWGGDGFGCTWHTGDNSIQYLSTQNAIYRRQFGTSIPISPIDPGDNDFWYTNIEMHTTDPDYVFVSTFNEIYRGNGDAFSFTWDSLYLSDTFTLGIVDNFIQGVNNPNIMYACIDSSVLRCGDITATRPVWTSLTVPFNAIENPIDVQVDPLDANRIWVCLGGYTNTFKVFFSPDGGSSWTNLSGNLPNVPMRSLVYEPGSNDGIYVGSEIGVFYRNASMSDWIYFSNFLPNTQIHDIKISGGYVYAGTFGRGIWRSPVISCPYDLVLTPGNDLSNPLSIGHQVYHAENTLTTTRLISGNLANIQYNAGNYIDMEDGFWLKAGGLMEVRVDGCPD